MLTTHKPFIDREGNTRQLTVKTHKERRVNSFTLVEYVVEVEDWSVCSIVQPAPVQVHLTEEQRDRLREVREHKKQEGRQIQNPTLKRKRKGQRDCNTQPKVGFVRDYATNKVLARIKTALDYSPPVQFLQACQIAEVLPTKRQFMKWLNKTGQAWANRPVVA